MAQSENLGNKACSFLRPIAGVCQKAWHRRGTARLGYVLFCKLWRMRQPNIERKYDHENILRRNRVFGRSYFGFLLPAWYASGLHLRRHQKPLRLRLADNREAGTVLLTGFHQ
jgi:hypothetical protein